MSLVTDSKAKLEFYFVVALDLACPPQGFVTARCLAGDSDEALNAAKAELEVNYGDGFKPILALTVADLESIARELKSTNFQHKSVLL